MTLKRTCWRTFTEAYSTMTSKSKNTYIRCISLVTLNDIIKLILRNEYIFKITCMCPDYLCRYEDAIPDFEAVLKLDKDCACAHTSLGLIYMNNLENHHR